MDVVKEIEELKRRVDMLSNTVSQAGKNQTAVTGKVDDTSNRVDAITPYTETKTAYYGESKKTFYDVPDGNLNVYFTNYDGNYSVSRMSGKLTISFDTLTKQTDITISIQ